VDPNCIFDSTLLHNGAHIEPRPKFTDFDHRSGRFLLLKFFSPQLSDRECRDNIDVQYVAARGYAGPRFFPSVEMQ